MIGNGYIFDGVLESIEVDRVVVSFTSNGDVRITAEVYLNADEPGAVVPMQQVTFMGRVD